MTNNETIHDIELSKLSKHPVAASVAADPDDREAVAESIAANDLLNPLLVMPADKKGHHQILDGCGRYDALREAGRETARCIIYTGDLAPRDVVWQINFARRRMSASSRILAWMQLFDRPTLTVRQLSDDLRCSTADIIAARDLLIDADSSDEQVAQAAEDVIAKVVAGELALRGAKAAAKGLIANGPGAARPEVRWPAVVSRGLRSMIHVFDQWERMPVAEQSGAVEMIGRTISGAPGKVKEEILGHLIPAGYELVPIAKKTK